jgi:hypothetical protein
LKEEEAMAKGARTGILLIVLAVCVGGWLIQDPTPPATSPAPNPAQGAVKKYPTPAPPYPKAKNWTLIVGPDPCQVREAGKDVPVAVIWRGTHSIKYLPDSGQLLGIVFHAPATSPTAPQPFKKMTFAGTDADGSYMYSLVCDQPGHACLTGTALTGSKGGYWKTDQILAGKAPCDAGIIIQP